MRSRSKQWAFFFDFVPAIAYGCMITHQRNAPPFCDLTLLPAYCLFIVVQSAREHSSSPIPCAIMRTNTYVVLLV